MGSEEALETGEGLQRAASAMLAALFLMTVNVLHISKQKSPASGILWDGWLVHLRKKKRAPVLAVGTVRRSQNQI